MGVKAIGSTWVSEGITNKDGNFSITVPEEPFTLWAQHPTEKWWAVYDTIVKAIPKNTTYKGK